MVAAVSKTEAFEKLRMTNTEGCPIHELTDLQIHFNLRNDGTLAPTEYEYSNGAPRFEGMPYPLIAAALWNEQDDEEGADKLPLTRKQMKERLRVAVQQEREAVKANPIAAPGDEMRVFD